MKQSETSAKSCEKHITARHIRQSRRYSVLYKPKFVC